MLVLTSVQVLAEPTGICPVLLHIHLYDSFHWLIFSNSYPWQENLFKFEWNLH